MPGIKLLVVEPVNSIALPLRHDHPVAERATYGEYHMPPAYAAYVSTYNGAIDKSLPASRYDSESENVLTAGQSGDGQPKPCFAVATIPPTFTSTNAQAAFIKHSDATAVPTQFTLAIGTGAWGSPHNVTEHFASHRQHETIHLQTTGIPINDLTKAFHAAATPYGRADTETNTHSTLAACHLQLANGKYYAHIGNVGDGMVVVLNATGAIKYQTGATRYGWVHPNPSVKPLFIPTTVRDLVNPGTTESFKKDHLTQQHMELAEGDVAVLLSEDAALALGAETVLTQLDKTLESSYGDGNTPLTLHQKKTTFRTPNALQAYVQDKSLHDINLAMTTAVFTSVEKRNVELAILLPSFLGWAVKLIGQTHTSTVSLSTRIDSMPFKDLKDDTQRGQARLQLKTYLSSQGLNINETTATAFLELARSYFGYLQDPSKELFAHLPINQETTDLFLFALLPEKIMITLEGFLSTLQSQEYQLTKLIEKLFITSGHYPKETLLRDFLRDICHIAPKTVTTVMVFKTPSYKTELIRSWIFDNGEDPKVRANLFTAMRKAGVTQDDLAAAIDVFKKEKTGTDEAMRLDNEGRLTLQDTYSDVDARVTNSHIEVYIAAIAALSATPEVLTAEAAAALVTDYSIPTESGSDSSKPATVIDHILNTLLLSSVQKTCINLGYGMVKNESFISPELATTVQEALASYIQRQLPQLLNDLNLYIQSDQHTRAGQIKGYLLRLRKDPIIAMQPNTTSRLQGIFSSSPSQKLIDARLKTLNGEIEKLAAEMKARRTTSMTYQNL